MQLYRPLLNDDGKNLPVWCAKMCHKHNQQKKEQISAHHERHLRLPSQKKNFEERAFFTQVFFKKRDLRCARANKVVVLFYFLVNSLSFPLFVSRAEFKKLMARFNSPKKNIKGRSNCRRKISSSIKNQFEVEKVNKLCTSFDSSFTPARAGKRRRRTRRRRFLETGVAKRRRACFFTSNELAF